MSVTSKEVLKDIPVMEQRTATLYARIKSVNKEFLEYMASVKDASVSLVVDKVIDKMRLSHKK